jgi:hypothetical protein
MSSHPASGGYKYRGLVLRDSGMGLGVELTILPCKKKIVEKPPRNSAGFCGGQSLSWAVEPRKDYYYYYYYYYYYCYYFIIIIIIIIIIISQVSFPWCFSC